MLCTIEPGNRSHCAYCALLQRWLDLLQGMLPCRAQRVQWGCLQHAHAYQLQTTCRSVSVDAFKSGMYQWASTLTVSGANMPFTLPLAADLNDDGFDISFLRVIEKKPVRLARIACTVEPVEQV